MINKKNIINVNEAKLENGIKIISEEVQGSGSFALGIAVNIGSRDDFRDRAGLSHFVEHIVFRHSKKLSSKKISLAFESLGAYINAFTTKEFICFYVRALNENFDKVFKLLVEVTFNPLFREKDIEKERKVILEEIKSYDDDPEELIFDISEQVLFKGNAMEIPIVGQEESVKSITKEDLNNFHNSYFTPSNSIVAFSGDLPFEKIINSSKKILSSISGIETTRIRQVPEVNLPEKIEIKKDFQQSHILVCKNVPGMLSDERYLLAAINIILGDGMSSRLYQSLREKHGLVYSVYSSLQLYSDCGNITIYAGSEKRNYNRIVSLIFDEIEKILSKKITMTELNRAKIQLKSSTLMALESLSNRMQAIVKSEFSYGRYETIEETMKDINDLNLENINQCIDEHFHSDLWSQVIFIP